MSPSHALLRSTQTGIKELKQVLSGTAVAPPGVMSLLSGEVSVRIPEGNLELHGIIGGPHPPLGWVIFAHGSGSGRHSPRNHWIASRLQSRGFATLLVDLLTETESANRENVFDMELLSGRLLQARHWLEHRLGHPVPVAYFGSSTGAGAALRAAAHEPDGVFAVVSRGGRPDLARSALGSVKAPTLLLVGGEDEGIFEFNRESFKRLKCEKGFRIIPGAGHLFEEPGALESVGTITVDWLSAHAPVKEQWLQRVPDHPQGHPSSQG
jgi:putative phosphoribosyl transferase